MRASRQSHTPHRAALDHSTPGRPIVSPRNSGALAARDRRPTPAPAADGEGSPGPEDDQELGKFEDPELENHRRRGLDGGIEMGDRRGPPFGQAEESGEGQGAGRFVGLGATQDQSCLATHCRLFDVLGSN